MWLKNKTLLVIAPHPDDEILGCGGLIKKIKDNNGKVYVIFLTIGDTIDISSQKNYSSQDTRITEIENTAKFLGYDDWRIAFPGNNFHLKLDSIPQKDIINNIENSHKVSIEGVKPDIIATTQISDYNQDHRACATAVISACRPSPFNGKSTIEALLGYEFTANIESGIEPYLIRNLLVVLTEEDIQTKIKAMSLYPSQVRGLNHTRSLDNLKNLAKLRGAMGGVDYAEAFHIYRMLI